MIRTIYIWVLLSFCPLFCAAQSLTFNRTYGKAGYDDARSLIITPDGGIVFTGLCQSGLDPEGDLYLTKLNAAGTLIWSETYGRAEEDGGNHLLATTDGGMLVTGHTALSYGEACDGYLVKTDAKGKELWYVLLGAAFDDVTDCAVELPNHDYLITGRTEDAISRTFHVLLSSVSEKGKHLWTKSIETPFPSIAYQMIQSSDGGLLMAGYSYESTQAPKGEDMLVLKCDVSGNLLWSKRVGTAGDDRAFAIVADRQGGCFVAGGSADAQNAPLSILAYHIDGNGNEVASFRGDDSLLPGVFRAGASQQDGSIVFAGEMQSAQNGRFQPTVFMFDENLQLKHQQQYELPGNCRLRCMAVDTEGRVVLAGNNVTADLESDIFVLRQTLASSTLAIQEVEKNPLMLFPNPFVDFVAVKTPNTNKSISIALFTEDGRCVQEKKFEYFEGILQRGSLHKGIYLYQVSDSDGKRIGSGKLTAQ